MSERIVLEKTPEGGTIWIEREKLTQKMGEVFPADAIVEAAREHEIDEAAVANMTFIAYIKMDVARNDSAGWKKYRKVLRSRGYDI